MNRSEAKKLAETVTVDELKQMFITAKEKITDWTKVSSVNNGMTKGTSFNILSKCGVDQNTHILAKTNMIWEFGDYLPNYAKPPKKQKKQKYTSYVHHEDPADIDNWIKELES